MKLKNFILAFALILFFATANAQYCGCSSRYSFENNMLATLIRQFANDFPNDTVNQINSYSTHLQLDDCSRLLSYNCMNEINRGSTYNFQSISSVTVNGVKHFWPYNVTGVWYQYGTGYFKKDEIPQESQQSSFTIYPNPAKNSLNIDLNALSENNFLEFNIIDIHGKEHMKGILINKILNQISVKDLSPGIYFMSLVGNELSKKTKLIIH